VRLDDRLGIIDCKYKGDEMNYLGRERLIDDIESELFHWEDDDDSRTVAERIFEMVREVLDKELK